MDDNKFDFEAQLPHELLAAADALRENREVADGHLLERVLHRVTANSYRRRRWSSPVPRLAIGAALAVVCVVGATGASQLGVLSGIATLASSTSNSPSGSASVTVYCPTGTTGRTGTTGQTGTTGCTQPLTPGYWKNHQAQTTRNLPEPLGSFYTVTTFQQAQAVFAAMNCSNSSTSTQNAVGCLAGQLLAAELNVHNGVAPPACASNAISQANAFLSSVTRSSPPGVGYIGPTGTVYTLTAAQRAQAVALANTLNSFNNTGTC
jgi:hypothetical protein